MRERKRFFPTFFSPHFFFFLRAVGAPLPGALSARRIALLKSINSEGVAAGGGRGALACHARQGPRVTPPPPLQTTTPHLTCASPPHPTATRERERDQGRESYRERALRGLSPKGSGAGCGAPGDLPLWASAAAPSSPATQPLESVKIQPRFLFFRVFRSTLFFLSFPRAAPIKKPAHTMQSARSARPMVRGGQPGASAGGWWWQPVAGRACRRTGASARAA